ncbi:DNA polymerase III subunit chi [Escherichia coli]
MKLPQNVGGAGKRVLIACEDEQQAIRLDEALWTRPPESFVPHNLAGEGPRGGAPVEIAWPAKAQQQPSRYTDQSAGKFCRFCHRFHRSGRLRPL